MLMGASNQKYLFYILILLMIVGSGMKCIIKEEKNKDKLNNYLLITLQYSLVAILPVLLPGRNEFQNVQLE